MVLHNYLNQVGDLVGKDNLPQAIELLQNLLKNSPKLNEVIIQSARLSDISRQIQMGTIDSDQSNITKNKIRLAILELANEIETTVITHPQVEKEASTYAREYQSTNITSQTHSGKGDNIGRDKVINKSQQHLGGGDNVHGDKTTIISMPIRWTIVAGLCIALLGWYLIWGKPDTMPTANFEYYTEGAKNKIALAGKPVKFKDLSKGAFSIKWTFPDGETLTDKEVIRQFKYSGIYKIKLEAFSRRGDLVNEKIIYCEVFSTDNPADYVKVKIIFEGDERIKITGTPLLETPTVRPSWCKNLEECTWFVFKGTQPYSIFGAAINYINQNHCELHGSGSIEFVDGATYRIFYTDVSTCTMKMERVANGYLPAR